MANRKLDSFGTFTSLLLNGKSYAYASLPKFAAKSGIKLERLPFSMQILLENLLRTEDGITVKKGDIEAIAKWNPQAEPSQEIQFRPSRTLLQDYTGVPAVADMAAMRGAVKRLGGDPSKLNPLQPLDLVIDHSVMIDHFGEPDAFNKNAALEFTRNRERYLFLKWGQQALKNFRVVPPDTGIVHQVNLEYLSHVAMTSDSDGKSWVYPDSLVGADSHTTMINGLGVLGWGVGGIEAEAAMLGQPITMLIPQVIGFRLKGKLSPGTTATDLVLTVTEMLRKKGVVEKFVEFFGPGLENLTLADRATLANMAPEYGATIGIFPVDSRTTEYLRLTGRDAQASLVEAYFKAQGLWFDTAHPEPEYSDTLELDLSEVEPSLAGPSRPQDRISLSQVDEQFKAALPGLLQKKPGEVDIDHAVTTSRGDLLSHGSVVIAAITSCTNTSNPAGLVAAALLAKKAYEKGLKTKPWVKTSLAPGSKVVTDYLKAAGLLTYLESLKFHLVGYGCTTCIGNSGPLDESILASIGEGKLAVAAVLSGNRNFEGRIHAAVRANFLASPALVVAYALTGTMKRNLTRDPIGEGKDGKPVYLKDIWPSPEEIQSVVVKHVTSALFAKSYSDVFSGDQNWKSLSVPQGDLFKWEPSSTYIKEPPFFSDFGREPKPITDVLGARALAVLKDSVTTDHISPAGSISKKSPAGQYLIAHGVKPEDFNSFGARRGNHEVMIRGTFDNVRLKNQLVPGVEGGFTRHLPHGEQMTIFDAAMKYQEENVPLIVLAGKEYGTGSSRDWAAKGTKLLGVRAVISQSFERIHRSNLVGMGILPLEFEEGQSVGSLGLTGEEVFDIQGIATLKLGDKLRVRAQSKDGKNLEFLTISRIDTPNELEYFRHGGILPFVVRQML